MDKLEDILNRLETEHLLEKLEPQEYEIFFLWWFCGYTQHKIAQIMSKRYPRTTFSQKSISKRIGLIRDKLKNLVK